MHRSARQEGRTAKLYSFSAQWDFGSSEKHLFKLMDALHECVHYSLGLIPFWVLKRLQVNWVFTRFLVIMLNPSQRVLRADLHQLIPSSQKICQTVRNRQRLWVTVTLSWFFFFYVKDFLSQTRKLNYWLQLSPPLLSVNHWEEFGSSSLALIRNSVSPVLEKRNREKSWKNRGF